MELCIIPLFDDEFPLGRRSCSFVPRIVMFNKNRICSETDARNKPTSLMASRRMWPIEFLKRNLLSRRGDAAD